MKTYIPGPARFAALCVACLFTFAMSFNAAVAAPPVVPLTVQVQGDGWVYSKPGAVECPADCSASYKKSSSVTLSVVPGSDSRFVGWQGACSGTQISCTFKIRKSTRVTAVFERIENTDSTTVTEPDVTAEQEPDTTIFAPEESTATTDPTVLADDSTETIQLGWPVMSVD